MGIKTVAHPPYSPDLAPCDFWLFPKLRGCRYETIEEMKEAVTKVTDTLSQEDFHGTVQVHCSWRRLLRRRLEFHVCTINKSAHTKKSLETYLMILVYVSTWFFCFRLAVLHFMFLSDGKVVFYNFIIPFKFYKFIFCSSVSVCPVLFGCEVFLFSKVSGSFRLDCSCLSILVSVIALVSSSLFLFWCISNISAFLYYCSNLVSESLACCLKTSAFLLDLYHSFSVSS